MTNISETAMIRHSAGPSHPAAVTRALPWAAALVTFAAAWGRHWTSDDGLIAVRVAEQIADGNGPVINAGERVEASTSVLWPWLLSLFAWLPIELTWIAVGLGAALSASAVGLAVAAGQRLHADSERPCWPAGLWIVLAVPAFWDFFTSGLETGLCFLWLSLAWRALLRRLDGAPRPWLDAVLLGLGPLVRPELTVVTIVFAVAAVLAVRSMYNLVWWAALVVAPGLVYQLFRAAYFGVLVPNPAITKEAGRAYWSQGFWYLGDIVAAYQLWLPLAAIALLVLPELRRLPRRTVVAVVAPLVAGLVMTTYVVRVGGDFMHARLLLPSLYSILLPVLVWPFRGGRPAVGSAAVVVVWSVVCVIGLRPAYSGTETFHNIVDERSQLSTLRDMAHVVTVDDHLVSNENLVGAAEAAARSPRGVSYVPYWGWREQAYLTIPTNSSASEGVLAAHALGVTSMVAGRYDLRAQDLLGLADPITAHYRLTGERGRPGHEKWLPDAWIVARYADSGVQLPEGVSAQDVQSARKALECGPLPELRVSISAPLTVQQFLSNLAGAWERTDFRFAADPRRAQVELCR